MQSFASSRGINLGEDQQVNFALITTYIQDNEVNNVRTAITATLAGDADTSAPDLGTESSQVAMSTLFGRPTAIDGRQTDNMITVENSQTLAISRDIVADAEITTDAELEGNPISVVCPFGINSSYIISDNRVTAEMSELATRQQNNQDSPEYILAYSETANSYVLLVNLENGHSGIYQISDRVAENIRPGIEDGSIAMDVSARRNIAERDFGNSSGTRSYSDADIRSAYLRVAKTFYR